MAVVVGVLVVGGRVGNRVWPAVGWMAATLFALAGFRNTAEGSSPIGCLLDCTALLGVVAFGVVMVHVVPRGTPVEPAPSSDEA
ncbi:DUF4436 family protein [Streptomyces sp. NPDC012637]|uniref:DUF4436 family protein n=1 Tax=Streptomyces sp. NPDC012637 TaxID=3364842 RepID=UPI0036E4C92F